MLGFMISLFLTIFLFVIVVKIFSASKKNEEEGREEKFIKEKSLYKYSKKNFLLTNAEKDFFLILNELIGDKYYIFPQVHISSLLEHKIVGQNWRGAFSSINQKSVDFAVYEKGKNLIAFVIELDDKSHNTFERADRDGMVNTILIESGIPVIRIKNAYPMTKEYVSGMLPGWIFGENKI